MERIAYAGESGNTWVFRIIEPGRPILNINMSRDKYGNELIMADVWDHLAEVTHARRCVALCAE